MPQASDKQRDLMLKWFGDEISEYGPIVFLKSRGYKLRQDWCWSPPVSAHTITQEELECLLFLIDEWDFGPVVGWCGKYQIYEDA